MTVAPEKPITHEEVLRLADAFERSANWLDRGLLEGPSRTHPLVGTADYRRASQVLRIKTRGKADTWLAETQRSQEKQRPNEQSPLTVPPLPKVITMLSDLQSGTQEVYDAEYVRNLHAVATARECEILQRMKPIPDNAQAYTVPADRRVSPANVPPRMIDGPSDNAELSSEDYRAGWNDCREHVLRRIAAPAAIEALAAVPPLEPVAWRYKQKMEGGGYTRYYHFGPADTVTPEALANAEPLYAHPAVPLREQDSAVEGTAQRALVQYLDPMNIPPNT